ncbi:MAG TPA: YezD family protein [Gemmatimonadales bacterium]|nr:YezD family protein [Gemmatimonadales bacterium]
MDHYAASPAGLQAGPDDALPLPQALIRELRQALQSIRYGAIELVIHDGRVVQLERHEKVRFDVEVREHKRQ